MYRYKLRRTGHSSTRFGLCEICKKYASEVWYQVEMQAYTKQSGKTGWTYFGCHNLFGHKECLEGHRKEATS